MAFLFEPSISGVSGDMVLACLYAAGADPGVVEGRLSTLSEVSIKQKGGSVNQLRIDIEPDVHSANFSEMKKLLGKVELGKEERGFCARVLDTLDQAEKKAHGGEHGLEELGSLDTLVDVVGAACAAKGLGMFDSDVFSLPVAVGVPQGEHQGLAVNVMLEDYKIPFIKREIEHELTTPTGLALLLNLAEFKERFYYEGGDMYMGKGTAELPGQHILKLVIF